MHQKWWIPAKVSRSGRHAATYAILFQRLTKVLHWRRICIYRRWECKEQLMSTAFLRSSRNTAIGFAMTLLVTAGTAFAQEAPANAPQNSTPAQQQNPAPQDGWKRFNGGWSNPPTATGTPTPRANAAPVQDPAP